MTRRLKKKFDLSLFCRTFNLLFCFWIRSYSTHSIYVLKRHDIFLCIITVNKWLSFVWQWILWLKKGLLRSSVRLLLLLTPFPSSTKCWRTRFFPHPSFYSRLNQIIEITSHYRFETVTIESRSPQTTQRDSSKLK